jgi:hypothetical protein
MGFILSLLILPVPVLALGFTSTAGQTTSPDDCQTPNFTLVALPDTQYYASQTDGGTIEMFEAQTQWIVNNKTTRNIVYTTHLGDLVNNPNNPDQWKRASGAIGRLEAGSAAYGLAIGNHDGGPLDTGLYNQTFGFSRFIDRPYFGGHADGDNDNNFGLFSAGSLDFIVIHIEYQAEPAMREWANTLLQTYSDRRAIVVLHNLLVYGNPDPNFSAEAQALYDVIKGNSNLILMLGGHSDREVRRTDKYNGNTVYSMRSAYHGRMGGSGWLRVLEFRPAANQIQVYTYSPYLNRWETDLNSQFTLAVDLSNPYCNPYVIRFPLAVR